ncbi:DUF1178 family protein [Eoetvoesiella caeni]
MSLKVFDLQCELGHVFEGWFSSLENYDSQQAGGLLSCPVCDNRQIARKLSAPRLNMGRGKDESGAGQEAALGQPSGKAQPVAAPGMEQLAQLQAQVLQHMRQMVRNTEDVGADFVQEARRMHEGEIEERAIRGTATMQERESLARDGIAVMPIPDYLDDDRLQ